MVVDNAIFYYMLNLRLHLKKNESKTKSSWSIKYQDTYIWNQKWLLNTLNNAD